MSQPESKLSANVLKALKARGIFAFKVHGGPTQMTGLPDIITCVDGKFIGIEMKMPGKRANVTDRQRYVHTKIRQAGGDTWICCSVSEVMLMVDSILGTP